MKTIPRVSVIVTTFNRKELLKETLLSILAQTYKNFELIVVDNFSDYNFFEHIKEYNDERIRPFQNQNNGIIAVNRNFGMKQAKGNYWAFCDDDDLWHTDKLEIQLAALTNEDLIGCGTDIVEFVHGLPICTPQKRKRNLYLGFRELATIRSLSLSGLMVKCNKYLFNESESYVTFEDFDYQLNLSYKTNKKFKFINEYLVYYRVHPNASNLKKINTTEVFGAIEKYDKNLFELIYKEIYFKRYYQAANKTYKKGEFNAARKYAIKALSQFQVKLIKSNIKLILIIIKCLIKIY
jgi:teichuronic acid biosynthesis glycosyltransferase TuaG